ncbi:MAG: hypothetical protein JXR75_00975 [Rhodobacteraceae bacterium]|nr:hypothetical protein [Paracoccaceae bacterium]
MGKPRNCAVLRKAVDAYDYQFSTLEGLVFLLNQVCYERLEGSIHAKDGALMALADVISAKVLELAELRSKEWVAAGGKLARDPN